MNRTERDDLQDPHIERPRLKRVGGRGMVQKPVKAIWTLIIAIGALGAGSAPKLAAQTFSEFPVPGGYPSFIAAGPDGNLWFTEPAADKIGRITMAGEITEFSLPPGSHPQGIAAGPDGNLWFAEESRNIGRISIAGVITHFALPNEGFFDGPPFGLASGPDGQLWFTKPGLNRVGRIGTNGAVDLFEVYYEGPFAITGGPDGNVWFTDRNAKSGKICRITPAGVTTPFGGYGHLGEPAGITVGPDGNLWFADETLNKIGRITPDGIISLFALPSGGNPFGITTGSENDLWFTEKTGNKIGRITTSGLITEFSIPTAGSGPTWIAMGADGNIWFAEESARKIGHFTIAQTRPGIVLPSRGPGIPRTLPRKP